MGDLFGGTTKKGLKAQRQYNDKLLDLMQSESKAGRQDILDLYPQGMVLRGSGYQGALDVMGQSIPQQMQAFQQGNVAAQQQLLAGMPQYQNAIMGLPVDNSALQPVQIPFDTSWMQQNIPGAGGSGYDLSVLLGGGAPAGQSAGGQTGGLSGQGTGGGRVGYPEGQQAGLSGGQMRGAGPGYTGGYSPDGSGIPGGWFGGGGMGGGSGGGWGGMGDTYNATDLEKLFGRQDIGSLGQLGLSENGGRIGQLASLLTGVPGLGLLGKWLGNQNIDNKTWMSPVDPNDPYGTNADPTGLFAREQLPNSPMLPQERGWSGRQQAYDPRGSITGGGAFNYATRLKLPTHSGTRSQG